MNKKKVSLIALVGLLSAIAYVGYRSLSNDHDMDDVDQFWASDWEDHDDL